MSEAARRHRQARAMRQEPGPSLLDRIDEISRKYEAAAEAGRPPLRSAVRRRPEPEPVPAYVDDDVVAGTGDVEPEPSWQPELPRRTADAPAASPFADGAPLIDPRYVFRAIRRWRYLIAATTILGGLAGVATAINTPKLYFSAASIMVDPRNYKVIDNDLNPDVFLSESALAIVDSQVSLMRSPKVLEKVVNDLSLAKDPEFNGTAKGPLSAFFGLLGGGGAEDQGSNAASYLAKHMTAERSAKTFVVNVAAYTQDPQKSALVANKIVEVFLQEQALNRSDTASRASGELTSRLADLKKKVTEAGVAVARYKAENNLVDAQGRLIGDEEILRVNDQLAAARSTTITLNARAQSVRSASVDAIVSGGLPEELASSTLTALKGQYSAARQRHDGLAAKLGPMHPDLKQAATEVESLRNAIGAEIGRIRSSIQTDLKRAVETEQSLAARLAQLKAGQADAGEAGVKLRELEREAATATSVYEQFLLRARETGEQGTINANNVQIISEAKPADVPEGSSRKLIVIGGALAGMIAGLGLAVSLGIFQALKDRFAGQGGIAPQAPLPPQRRRARRTVSDVFAAPDRPAAQRAAAPAMQAAPMAQASVPQPVQTIPAQHPLMQPQVFHQPVMMQQPMMMQPQMVMPGPMMMQPPVMPGYFAPAQQAFGWQPVMPQPHYAYPAPMAYPQQAPHPMPVHPQPVAQAPAVAEPQAATPPLTPTRQQPDVRTMSDLQGSLDDIKAELMELAQRRRRA